MALSMVPGRVLLTDLADVFWNGTPVVVAAEFHPAIERSARRIAEIAAGNEPVYGVNTGFGKLASIRIDAADSATLQRNLVLSHCCGFGAPLTEPIVRLILTLKLISLGRGAMQGDPAGNRLAREIRLTLPDHDSGEVGERRQIPGRANRTLFGDMRNHASLEHGFDKSDEFRAHAGRATPE